MYVMFLMMNVRLYLKISMTFSFLHFHNKGVVVNRVVGLFEFDNLTNINLSYLQVYGLTGNE